MSLFNPANLLFLLLAIPLILLYFLKLKRRPVAVGSTLLWEKTLEDLRVNSPFQRLRGSLLLLLQLLALALLIFAVARLFFEGDKDTAAYRVILIDTSASMGAIETADGQTRLEKAIAAITEQINAAPGDHHFCLMLFDKYAHNPLVNFTNDKARLMRALGEVRPTDMGTDPQEALRLAESLAGERAAEIFVYSDGRFPRKLRVQQPPRFTLTGEADKNIGIINFAARRRANDPTRFDLAVQIANAGPLPVPFTLQILKDGALLDAKQGMLMGASSAEDATKTRASFVIDDPRLTAGMVEARLSVEGASAGDADRLDADNVAVLVLPELTPRTVLLVSAGHFYLEQLLGTTTGFTDLAPEVTARKIPPDEAKAVLVDDHGFDIIVFDNVPVEKMPDPLPPGSYAFVNCVPPGGQWALAEPAIQRPIPLTPAEAHPILRFVEINSLQILETPTLKAPEWAEHVLNAIDPNALDGGNGGEGEGTPARREEAALIAFASRNERTMLVVAFDLFQSNWPLQLSFPVFWANVLRYMFRGTVEDEVFALSTDSSVSFVRPAGVDATTARLTGPNGYREGANLSGDNRFHFGYPGRVGIYELVIGDLLPQKIALNLVNADESKIAPSREIAVDTIGDDGETTIAAEQEIKANVELWPLLILVAIAFLMVEWWVYHRRPFG